MSERLRDLNWLLVASVISAALPRRTSMWMTWVNERCPASSCNQGSGAGAGRAAVCISKRAICTDGSLADTGFAEPKGKSVQQRSTLLRDQLRGRKQFWQAAKSLQP